MPWGLSIYNLVPIQQKQNPQGSSGLILNRTCFTNYYSIPPTSSCFCQYFWFLFICHAIFIYIPTFKVKKKIHIPSLCIFSNRKQLTAPCTLCCVESLRTQGLLAIYSLNIIPSRYSDKKDETTSIANLLNFLWNFLVSLPSSNSMTKLVMAKWDLTDESIDSHDLSKAPQIVREISGLKMFYKIILSLSPGLSHYNKKAEEVDW